MQQNKGIEQDGDSKQRHLVVSMQKELCEAMTKLAAGDTEICAVPVQGPDLAVFREAMSRIAASVHIVTTDGPAGLAGITATTIASITLEPPMMLFCINKTSPSAVRIVENGVFCINTLFAVHEPLADIFAGRTGHRLVERFTQGAWTKLVTGCPVLRGAAAAFDCRLVEAKEVMTHFVMIGAVEAVDFNPEGGGLTYARRRYATHVKGRNRTGVILFCGVLTSFFFAIAFLRLRFVAVVFLSASLAVFFPRRLGWQRFFVLSCVSMLPSPKPYSPRSCARALSPSPPF